MELKSKVFAFSNAGLMQVFESSRILSLARILGLPLVAREDDVYVERLRLLKCCGFPLVVIAAGTILPGYLFSLILPAL